MRVRSARQPHGTGTPLFQRTPLLGSSRATDTFLSPTSPYSPTNLHLLGLRENSTGYPMAGLTPISTTEQISTCPLMAVPFSTFLQLSAHQFQVFCIPPFLLINNDLTRSIIHFRLLRSIDFSSESGMVNSYRVEVTRTLVME